MEKRFPDNYPPEIISLLDKASFSNGTDINIVGSSSIRQMQYAADIDCYEKTNIHKNPTKQFQQLIKAVLKTPLTYITDIKAGSIQEWIVLPLTLEEYDQKTSLKTLSSLYASNVLTKEEHDAAKELLPKSFEHPVDFLLAKQNIKFNIVRWTPKQILQGHQLYRTRNISLADALSQPSIIKLDMITLVDNNRFIEVSIIYELFLDNKPLNNFPLLPIKQSLKNSILEFVAESNYFKVAKRIYSLAVADKDKKLAKSLIPFFNSDLGRLYTVISDLNTLLLLIEHTSLLPTKRIKFELEHVPATLSNIWSLTDFLHVEPQIDKELYDIVKEFTPDSAEIHIEKIRDKLQQILNKHTKKYLIARKLLPQ